MSFWMLRMRFGMWVESLPKPLPPMDGYLQQHMSYWDKRLERFYTFVLFKFPAFSIWGARRLGGLHGRYNWPPGPIRKVKG